MQSYNPTAIFAEILLVRYLWVECGSSICERRLPSVGSASALHLHVSPSGSRAYAIDDCPFQLRTPRNNFRQASRVIVPIDPERLVHLPCNIGISHSVSTGTSLRIGFVNVLALESRCL